MACMDFGQIYAALMPLSPSSDFTIIGVPFDGLVSCRKGAALAPSRIRHWSKQITPFSEDRISLKLLNVADSGDIIINNPLNDFRIIEQKIAGINNIPIILGGDHSITIPVIKSLKEKYKNKKLGLLWLDAHPDLCNEFNGSKLSHACVLRRALDYGINEEDVCMVGIRSWEEQEVDFIKNSRLNLFTAMEIADKGMKIVCEEITKILSKCDAVYISFDIDALDSTIAPGTGIPDCGGISMREALTLIKSLRNLPLVGLDVVEVAPNLDISESTVFAALKIIMEFIALKAK
ncbi:MAG: agmatinase [Candidatus Nanoarchaeia archaeon]|jgi:agmatinase